MDVRIRVASGMMQQNLSSTKCLLTTQSGHNKYFNEKTHKSLFCSS